MGKCVTSPRQRFLRVTAPVHRRAARLAAPFFTSRPNMRRPSGTIEVAAIEWYLSVAEVGMVESWAGSDSGVGRRADPSSDRCRCVEAGEAVHPRGEGVERVGSAEAECMVTRFGQRNHASIPESVVDSTLFANPFEGSKAAASTSPHACSSMDFFRIVGARETLYCPLLLPVAAPPVEAKNPAAIDDCRARNRRSGAATSSSGGDLGGNIPER